MYKYYQPNKLDVKDKYGDCAIRALTKLTGKTWRECFEMLVPICIEVQSVPNSKEVFEVWLKRNGYTYQGISNKKGSKRPTVAKFSRTEKIHALLVVASHYVTCQDGHYYDTWDSGDCCMYGYWYKS